MSRKLSRREFLQMAGATTLAGAALAACQPAVEPTQEPAAATKAPDATKAPAATPVPQEEKAVLHYFWVANQDTEQRSLVEAAINEYIEPIINANVIFHLVGWGD